MQREIAGDVSRLGLRPDVAAQILRIRAAWRVALAASCIFVFAVLASAGVITGQIQTATGGVIANGTLTFQLSQPAVLSGTASIATQSTNCYLATSGNIVGVPDPLALPLTATNTSSGTLAAATYYVKLTYWNASGESVASPEATVVLTSTGTLIVNPPNLQPTNASGYNVYIGTSSGSETKQASITGWTQYQQASALTAGFALPSSNTSSCSVYFSDQLIPTGTYYTVSLTNQHGSLIAGFPQTWCTYGGAVGTINVSNGAPTGNCGANGVFYPTPIYANPQNNAQQSVSGPFFLNAGGGLLGIFGGPASFTDVYSINRGPRVDGTHYAYSAAGVNQCLGDAQVTSGVCNASSVPATTFTAQITVNAGETLIVPATDVSSWTWSGINDGTSCGIDVEGGGALLGTGPSNGNQTVGRFKMLTSGTVSMRGLLCGNISGTSNYLRIEPGLIVLPQTGASFAKGAIDIEGWFDASILRNVSVSLTQDTTPNQTGFYASNLCCSATIERMVSDGGFQAGALPCHITFNSGEVATDSPLLLATSCDHPGSGKNAKLYDGTTTGPILDINGYAESSNTDTTTAVVSVTATKGGVTFIGGKVNILAAASTAYCYDLPNTAGNSFQIVGGTCLSSTGGAQNAINDHLNSFTSTSGSDGRIRDYKSGFGQTSGLIASGTAAMTTAAIASGACGTTVTVAATGVTTADAIEITPNASVTTPNGLLTLQKWPTSGNVNFAYCNPTAGSQTPTAATINWRVSR